MQSRNGLFSGTYPLIYSHPWSFFMGIHYIRANFWSPYLSNITRSTCMYKHDMFWQSNWICFHFCIDEWNKWIIAVKWQVLGKNVSLLKNAHSYVKKLFVNLNNIWIKFQNRSVVVINAAWDDNMILLSKYFLCPHSK